VEVPRRCFGGCAAWAGALGGGGQGLQGEFVAEDFELGDRPCSGVGRLVPDESRRLSLATAGVGEDGREAVHVGVGDPHLRPGVGRSRRTMRFDHYREHPGAEVDALLETTDGRIVAIGINATATVRARDTFAGSSRCRTALDQVSSAASSCTAGVMA